MATKDTARRENPKNPYLSNLSRAGKDPYHMHKILFGGGSIKPEEISQLQFDDHAKITVTPARDADGMSHTCFFLLPGIRNLKRKPVITDGCAGVGGNVLSFILSGFFSQVNAVEINENRANMLQHNVTVIRKITPANIQKGSYNDLYSTLKQDIVFLDPPWGGVTYKVLDKIQLFLSDENGQKHLAKIIKDLFLHTQTMYVVWKAPFNFDLQDMKEMTSEYGGDVLLLQHFSKYNLFYVAHPKLRISK